MFPNDQPALLDYLNQISSPQPKKRGLFANKKILIIAVLAAITIVVIISAMISSLSSGVKPNERLAARLLSTQEIVDSSTGKVKDSQLVAYNGNLKIFLTNTIRDITPLLTKDKIDIKKLSAAATKAESSQPILNRLEDARLNVDYDNTYAREMAYQLDSLMSLMTQIYKNTSSSSLKTFLESTSKNLVPTQKQFADFNTTNE